MPNPLDKVFIQEMYDAYIKAEKAILSGQSYSIGDRTLTKANLKDVIAAREKWGSLLNSAVDESGQVGGIRVKRIIPRGGA